MNYTEIVKKLIGNIRPVGETNEDERRFENLKNMCELVNDLFNEIDFLSNDFKTDARYSVKKANIYATDFIKSIRD